MNNNYITAKYRNCPNCDVFYQQDIGGNKHLVRKCFRCPSQFFPVEEGLQIRTVLSKRASEKRTPKLVLKQDKLW